MTLKKKYGMWNIRMIAKDPRMILEIVVSLVAMFTRKSDYRDSPNIMAPMIPHAR